MKDSEKLFEAIGDIRDDQIEDAEERSLKPGRARRRFWFGAIAALLAVAMAAGYFALPGGRGTSAYAISEPVYPDTAAYPREEDYFAGNGEFDSDAYSDDYEAWWEGMRAKPDASRYAGGVGGYFTAVTGELLPRAGGGGLGLAIAKEILALHGGTIRAASADNRITFTVRLPLQEAAVRNS